MSQRDQELWPDCLLVLSKETTGIGSWTGPELGRLPSVHWGSPLLGVSEMWFLLPQALAAQHHRVHCESDSVPKACFS